MKKSAPPQTPSALAGRWQAAAVTVYCLISWHLSACVPSPTGIASGCNPNGLNGSQINGC